MHIAFGELNNGQVAAITSMITETMEGRGLFEGDGPDSIEMTYDYGKPQ